MISATLSTAPSVNLSQPGPALVLDVASQERSVLVQFEDNHTAWARLALAGGMAVHCGDQVLVTGSDADGLYVIGVLETNEPKSRQMNLDNGGCVVVDDQQFVRLLDEQQQTLVQYDTNTGTIRIAAPTGDLELVASHGDIRLQAAGQVQIAGQDAIAVASPRMEVDVMEAEVHGARMEVVFDHVRLVSRKLETVAESVIETFRNLYCNVADLCQLKAGRTRTVVDGSSQMSADKVVVQAEGDVKINGGHIHLG